MKTLILIGGLPGVGKSTISGKIASRFRGQFLDIDVFKKETADPSLVKSEIDPPDIRRIYYQKALQTAFSLFQKGIPVIVMEEVFHLALLRNEITRICDSKDVKALWIEVTCSYETVEARLSTKSRDGHILTTEEALKMHLLFKKVFENFPLDSGHVHIDNNGNDLDTELDKVTEHVGELV